MDEERHFGVVHARVVENIAEKPDLWRIVLEVGPDFGPPRPGQFVQLECPPEELFSLWRPFSISRWRPARREIELVYGVVGPRTRGLATTHPGSFLQLLGPLGSAFTPVLGRHPVLVGGGRGIAPMIGLADVWRSQFDAGDLLYGARTQSLLLPLSEVAWPVHISTDDGSAGFSGHVLSHLEHLAQTLLPAPIALYACGPNRMLAALSVWAKERNVPCQVSLETHFGCGIGICAGCAVPVHPEPGADVRDAFFRYRFACLDGPVMEGARVEWEGVAE